MELKLRLGFFIGCFLLLALIEYWRPLRSINKSKASRWLSNLGLAMLNVLLLRLLPWFSLIALAYSMQLKGFGLLPWLGISGWLGFAIGILVLDLAIFFQHLSFHYVPWFWRLHRVHHTDIEFDVSTGLRFHPLEIGLSLAWKACVVVLFGISPWTVLGFEIILSSTSLFTHANFTMLKKVDSLLRLIIVTPDMHRIHHTSIPQQTNSNFSFNFSIWDRIFRTYCHQAKGSQVSMELGLKEYRDPKQLSFFRLLIQPWHYRGGGG